MNYNFVTLINRWESSGLLNPELSTKQSVELARYLELAMKTLIPMDLDDYLPKNAGDFIVHTIIEIYEILTIRRFHDSEKNIRDLSENLKLDKHKINIKEIINMVIDIFDKGYISHVDLFTQMSYDMKLRNIIVANYLEKYGTK